MSLGRTILIGLMCSALAFAADPFVGAWKMNTAKTSSEPPMPKFQRLVIRIEPITGGVNFIEEVTDSDGKLTTTSHPHIFDGKEHPYSSRNADTIVGSRPDPRHIEVVFKKTGTLVSTGTWEVSTDGSTLTYTVAGRTAEGNPMKRKVIYELQ